MNVKDIRSPTSEHKLSTLASSICIQVKKLMSTNDRTQLVLHGVACHQSFLNTHTHTHIYKEDSYSETSYQNKIKLGEEK